MKLSIAIFCCLFAAICGQNINIVYPEKLFIDASATQTQINDMQTEIFITIKDLRLMLSDVLKKSANWTLIDIEADIKVVFEMVEPYENLLYVTHTQETDCLDRLRGNLKSETEFTGFEAGLCLEKYDLATSEVIEDAYKLVGIYDNELAQFELSVIAAFSAKNIWIEQEEIRALFTGSFDDFKAKLDDLKERIDGIGLDMEEKIAGFRTDLNLCYENNRNDFSAFLRRLTSQLDVCIRFDRLP